MARKKLDEKYKSNRKYIDVILIYTMSGNSLKHETCDESGTTGTITNARYKALTSLYYSSVEYLKGYYPNTKAFMVSHFPKDPSQNSGEKTRCKQGVSSAWKYYYSGEVFKNNLDESKIQYVDVFKLYVVPKSVSNHTMKWVSGMDAKYSTTDGTHMDETTTKDYTPKMFNEVLKKAGL